MMFPAEEDNLRKPLIVEERKKSWEGQQKHERSARRSGFITVFFERKKVEYGDLHKFEDDREKIEAEAEKQWEEYDRLFSQMIEIQERMEIEIVDWKVAEKIYNAYLKIDGYIHPETNLEKTLESWKTYFERAQTLVQERIKYAEYLAAGGELGDFHRRILSPDPKVRGEAVQYFLKDNVDKNFYLVETVKLILNELLKRR